MTCTTTHYACDCVLERMKKLEKVAEAARGVWDYECYLIAGKPIEMAKGSALYSLGEALKESK